MHVNWIATQAAGPGPLLEALGLQEVGASFNAQEADFAYACTSKGWQVIAGRAMKLELDRLAPALSGDRPVLAGEASDVVMFSRLAEWRAGARLWSVTHAPEDDVEGLAAEGALPSGWPQVEARLLARQAAEADAVDHLFDAPLELGQEICGFRPDEPEPAPWVLLARAPASADRPFSSLPAAIRAELLPELPEHGWTLAPVQCPSNDASRIRNGRLEHLTLLWRDDRRELAVVPSFAVLESERADAAVVVSGSIYKHRPSLLQRIRSWRPGRATKTYEEHVRTAIAAARADLPTIDDSIDTVAARYSAGS
jgi:hypothetical protein